MMASAPGGTGTKRNGGSLQVDHVTTMMRDADRTFCLEIRNLHMEPGRVVALSGPSGSGKTLVLELLGLLRRPDQPAQFQFLQGRAKPIDLAALWRNSGSALAATRGSIFGFVPQSGGLLPFLTVAENISLTQRISGREDASWVTMLLERLGIAAVRDLRPGALSIGQRQRTAIARALAHRPAFIFADEPTAALDPDASEAVIRLFLDLAQENGCGVFLSSHDLDLVQRHEIPRLSMQIDSIGGAVTSRLEGVA